MNEQLAILALFVFFYSILSGRFERSIISGPMVFVTAGFLMGPMVLGWFGPRGLASIVFAIIVLDEGLPGAEFIAIVVACTVFLSLFAHGMSANPLVRWLASKE